jgi:hypothetical protein
MLPYFDVLFEKLNQKNDTAKKAFSENVHWGFFDNPSQKTITANDYHNGAELMTEKVSEKANIKD